MALFAVAAGCYMLVDSLFSRRLLAFQSSHPHLVPVCVTYQGEMNALFLRHEGFLGAVGAFLKVHPMSAQATATRLPSLKTMRANSTKVRARFVERFSMGAPFAGGEVRGPAIKDMSDRVSWVEKFVRVGAAAVNEVAKQPSPPEPPQVPVRVTTLWQR